MSKKVYTLVIGITGAVCAGASAIVTYFDPAYCPAIVASIGVVNTAVNEICALFLNKEKAIQG